MTTEPSTTPLSNRNPYAGGTVTALPVAAGSQVDAGAVLAVLQIDEPEA